MKHYAAVLLFALSAAAFADGVRNTYTPYRFAAVEQWEVKASGNPGASRLSGKTWTVDFTHGAEWVSLVPADRVVLGDPVGFRLRLRGGAKGHPVHVYLSTHFMTFHKIAGELAGAGDQELAFDAPPGPDWQWFEGENDGKIHGPIRLGEIRLESGGIRDRFDLEMLSVAVETASPADHLCVMTARTDDSNGHTVFTAEPRCLGTAPLAGTLRWALRTWNGEQISSGTRQVSVPPEARPEPIRISAPALSPDLKFLEAEFALEIPGQEIPVVQTCWVASPPPHTDDQLRPESPFGMGVYLARFKGADQERTARVAREAGVKWSREDFEWPVVEPERGRFDWTFHENLIATARRDGISVYAIVSGWPSWTEPYSIKGIDDWVRFLKALVGHFKSDVHQWEIWNEPNIFFWQGPKDMYATLLIRSYQAIKEADPSAEVLGISTAGIDYNFIARTMALDAPFDILTIHPYRKVFDDRVFINELKAVSNLAQRDNGRRRPVWLTEMGWSTYTPSNTAKQDFAPTTLRENAQLLARSYLSSIVSGVEPRTFWYDFRNDGDDPLYFENEMGIVYRDFRPKPSYAAYSTLARVLAGKRLAGPAPSPGYGTYAYRFEGKGTAIAMWNPYEDTVIEVKAGDIVNTIGEVRHVPAAGGPLRLQLKRGAPVYLLLP